MKATIWHNPRCSKSRATLKLLEDSGIEVEIREYLEAPPSVEEIRAVLAALDIAAIGLVRTGEVAFREGGLTRASEGDDLVTAMAANPILIERPVVIVGGKAAIGRPPEAVLSLLHD